MLTHMLQDVNQNGQTRITGNGGGGVSATMHGDMTGTSIIKPNNSRR